MTRTTLLALATSAWMLPAAALAQPAPPSFPGEAPTELEEAEVTPRSSSVAFLMGFFPGLVVHGAGHFYAEDPEMGATLLGTEGASLIVFGVGWATWRYATKYSPYATSFESKKGGAITMLVGGAIFAFGWVGDFAHAPISAVNFNREHNLPLRAELITIDGRPTLLASLNF